MKLKNQRTRTKWRFPFPDLLQAHDDMGKFWGLFCFPTCLIEKQMITRFTILYYQNPWYIMSKVTTRRDSLHVSNNYYFSRPLCHAGMVKFLYMFQCRHDNFTHLFLSDVVELSLGTVNLGAGNNVTSNVTIYEGLSESSLVLAKLSPGEPILNLPKFYVKDGVRVSYTTEGDANVTQSLLLQGGYRIIPGILSLHFNS